MKNCKSILWVAGLVFALLVPTTASDVPPLTFKFTTVDVPGALSTELGGVNNSGVIVGQYEDTSGAFHGFMLNGKKLTTINDPNGTHTVCVGINANGPMTIVGYYTNPISEEPVGFLYKNGKFTDIPGPSGAVLSEAYGINDAGDVVGWFLDSKGIHGFLLKGKAYTTLDAPNADSTYGTGINDKGVIVLYAPNSNGGATAWLHNGKIYNSINVPGAVASEPSGINTAGDVIYSWQGSVGGPYHAALLLGSKYHKFDFPMSAQTFGGGINDHQLVTGSYQTQNGGHYYQGFKATYN